MQAWTQVQVINESSAHLGAAGVVRRNEGEGDNAAVFVELDTTGTVESFAASELRAL